jgi:hypothetical protein
MIAYLPGVDHTSTPAHFAIAYGISSNLPVDLRDNKN